MPLAASVPSDATTVAAEAAAAPESAPVAPVFFGPSSRRTPLVISEIMYHPRSRLDGRNLEFVEVHNSNPYPEELGGFELTGDVGYTFPAGTRLGPGGFVVVAAVPTDLALVSGLTNALGPYTNSLPNNRGTVRLRNRWGAVLLEVNYSDESPWPLAADGAGPSLVCARPSYGEGDPRAWSASQQIGGAPGQADPAQVAYLQADRSKPLLEAQSVVINEILARSVRPELDFVELFNASTGAVNLSGCWLADDAQTNKFRIPDGVVLGPGQFLAFDENQLGFAFRAAGDEVLLVNSNQTGVLDALRFGGQASGTAWGRSPNGALEWRELAAPTPGQRNAPTLAREIVINELMYHPISQDDDDEFVELFNRGSNTVSVGGWRFVDGIDFSLPAGTTLPAQGYLVVAKNRTNLLAHNPELRMREHQVVGDYDGTLSDRCERVALAKPEIVLSTNPVTLAVTTNWIDVVVSEVTYFDKSRWSEWADGGGSSLELVDARADPRLAAHWADSDESRKATNWVTIEHTGVLDHGHPAVTSIDQLHLFLLGKGEAVVDDVELVFNGVNRIANAGFESGTNGWFFHGTHRLSRWETNGGFHSARALRVVASDRGDVVNRVRTGLSTAPSPGATATLRAKARWVRGHPEILLRTVGSFLEAVGTLPVPQNLGTPGARNSRAVTNAGPAVFEVAHWPPLPRANQPITVTARVQDPDGVASVTLRYRVDPATTLASLPMNDAGTNGDVLAGDGIWATLLSGQATDKLVAFHIVAADAGLDASRQDVATSIFPPGAPARECLVRAGETLPSGAFGSYRSWMTQATFNFWSSRERASNEDVDTTFVYGNERVIYNVGAHYGASDNYSTILDTPTGVLVGYNLNFPGDDRLLGVRGVRLDFPVRDSTFLREPLMHWCLDQFGLPSLHRRFVHYFVNGVRRDTIYVDTERPSADYLEEWFHDDADGDLFKLIPWFEATPAGEIINQSPYTPRLALYTTTGGVKKLARYRFLFAPRATEITANDYSSLFALIDALNGPASGYESAVSRLVDLENWMRTYAMNDLAAYWDAFGNINEKNSYLYKPTHSGWKVLSWDLDVGLGVFLDPANAPLFQPGLDPAQQRLIETPAFLRHYWRAIEEGMNDFFKVGAGTAIDRFLSERYAALTANGISAVSPFVPSGAYNQSIPEWINARRAFITPQVAAVQSSFTVTGPPAFSTNQNVAVLTGTAPPRVAELRVNGVPYPLAWTSVAGWRMTVPLRAGTNELSVEGVDRLGQILSNATRTVSVNYTGVAEAAEDFLALNEIMYHPVAPAAEYVEVFNRSANSTFDLTGWRVQGIDFEFPPGTLIAPRQALVISQNGAAFANAYGLPPPNLPDFPGHLDRGGETLALLQPASDPRGSFTEISRVTYDDDPPWPAAADGQGAALQRIDAAQEANRVSNWSDGGGWRFFTFTGSSSFGGSRLSFYFETNGGDIFLDDVWLAAGMVPEAGVNLLVNGDFEAPLETGWRRSPLATNTAISLAQAHAGRACLRLVIEPGVPSLTTFFQDFAPVATNTPHTLSFWWQAGPRGTNLNVRLNAAYRAALNPAAKTRATPGAFNSVAASLPPYPPLWLSEVQPLNAGLVRDNAGDADPWLELSHSGAEPLDLSGFFLANGYTQLTQWAFPAHSIIRPGEYLLVWADGEPGESAGTNLHASFRLDAPSGQVALSRWVNGAPQILDYLNYADLTAGRSFGAWPAGTAARRREFHVPTPRAENNPAAAPPPVFINEWMAANAGLVRDPADGDSEDWFELYNASSTPVTLDGWHLTDRLSESNKFTIPPGFTVPPQGFLRVWADEETSQTASIGDLHVNFKLSQGGEAIGLFTDAGLLVDAVEFGPQTNNLSEGRFPDGAAGRWFMGTPTPGTPNLAPTPAQPARIDPASLVFDGVGFSFSFPSLAGRRYRVCYTDDLSQPEWLVLPGEWLGTGAALTVNDERVNSPQRFYKVLSAE